MVMSINYIIKRKLTKFSLIKIVSFLFLAWIYNTHDDMYTLDNYPGIDEEHVKIIGTVLIRSLAKHGFKEEKAHSKLNEKLSYAGDIMRANIGSNARSTYGNLKKGELNEFELYKKNYKNRYTKRNALKKLDCYWENKIFDKFEYVNNLAEKKKNTKKRFIRIILNKYSIFLFLIGLLPALGGIIPQLLSHKDSNDRVWKLVIDGCAKPKIDTPNICEKGYYHISFQTGKEIIYINEIITYMLFILVILMFVYILVKYIKYKFLKAGIRNITFKEFIRLLKNAL